MNELLTGILGSNILGLAVKHLIPSNKVNRFIPLINAAAASGYYFSQGVDPANAVVSGIVASMAAKGVHSQVVKETPLSQIQLKTWNDKSQGI